VSVGGKGQEKEAYPTLAGERLSATGLSQAATEKSVRSIPSPPRSLRG